VSTICRPPVNLVDTMLTFQNVPRQAGTAEETGPATKGWDITDVHEENEEA